MKNKNKNQLFVKGECPKIPLVRNLWCPTIVPLTSVVVSNIPLNILNVGVVE
jgi:hypothetical protein